MQVGFLKLNRTEDTTQLLKRPKEFILLTNIAIRAWRGHGINQDGCNKGEALIGDYENYGLSRQNYRTALNNLKRWRFITIKPTTRGTIARICDKRIYDINEAQTNQQNSQQVTINQPSGNHQVTNNKKERKIIHLLNGK